MPHLFRSSDGGVTWKEIDLPVPAGKPSTFYDTYACGTFSPNAFSAKLVIIDLRCVDSASYKIESDYVYSTSDGGKTWQTYSLPSDYAIGQGLFFLDPQTGFALGKMIYATTNGGQSWSTAKIVTWDGQFSITDASHAWAVARNGGKIALVMTVNGNSTWQQLQPAVAP